MPLLSIKVKLLDYKTTSRENGILIDSLISLITFLFIPDFINAIQCKGAKELQGRFEGIV